MNSTKDVICYSTSEKLKGKAVELLMPKKHIDRDGFWKVMPFAILIVSIFLYPFFFPPKGGE